MAVLMKYGIKILFVVGLLSSICPAIWADRIKDLTSVAGARSNQLIGYGLVVGLAGTGDRDKISFTAQSLKTVLERLGVEVDGPISNYDLYTRGVSTLAYDKTKLDNYFNWIENSNRFMGNIAVSKDGEIIYLKSIGYADISNNLKANKETKYRIGSISKSFTATLVLKAIENKKLELNQTIDKWFPIIKDSDKITIKQLLSHRSGIYNFTDNLNYLTGQII